MEGDPALTAFEFWELSDNAVCGILPSGIPVQ